MSTVTKININAMHLNKAVGFNCADMSVQQNFSPTWSEEQAYGKMDPIVAYSHTGREVSFNLVVLAHTVGTAMSLQSKVDNLIKFQYPKYKSQGTSGMVLSAPPFFRVSVLGGKMYSTWEGFMNSFSISPGSSEDVVPLVREGYFYERKYTIEFTLRVLHKGLPGWDGTVEPGGNGNSFVFTKQRGIGGLSSAAQQEAEVQENVEGAVRTAGHFLSEAGEAIGRVVTTVTRRFSDVAESEGVDGDTDAQAVGQTQTPD